MGCTLDKGFEACIWLKCKTGMGHGGGTHVLNKMAFSRKEAMKFEKIMLALGDLLKRIKGMIGRSCFDSTYRHAGKQTMKITSEAIMNGCDPYLCVSLYFHNNPFSP